MPELVAAIRIVFNANTAQFDKFLGRVRKLRIDFLGLEQVALVLNRVGDALTRLGKIGFRAIGATIGPAVKFDDVMTRLGALAEFTTSQVSALGQSFLELSSVLPLSAQQLGEVGVEAVRAGLRSRKAIEQMALVSGKLAAISSDLSEAQAAKQLAAIGIQFSKTGEVSVGQIKRIGDALARLQNIGIGTAGELANITKRFGTMAAKMGLTEEQVIAFGAAIRGAGIQVEVAGTAMGKFLGIMAARTGVFASAAGIAEGELARLINTGKGLTATLKFLRGVTDNGTISTTELMKRMESLGIRGQRQKLVVLTLANRMQLLERALKAAGDTTGSLNKIFGKFSESLEQKIKTLRGSIENLAIAYGATLKPFLVAAIDLMIILADILVKIPTPFKFLIVVMILAGSAAIMLIGSLVMLIAVTAAAAASALFLWKAWGELTVFLSGAIARIQAYIVALRAMHAQQMVTAASSKLLATSALATTGATTASAASTALAATSVAGAATKAGFFAQALGFLGGKLGGLGVSLRKVIKIGVPFRALFNSFGRLLFGIGPLLAGIAAAWPAIVAAATPFLLILKPILLIIGAIIVFKKEITGLLGAIGELLSPIWELVSGLASLFGGLDPSGSGSAGAGIVAVVRLIFTKLIVGLNIIIFVIRAVAAVFSGLVKGFLKGLAPIRVAFERVRFAIGNIIEFFRIFLTRMGLLSKGQGIVDALLGVFQFLGKVIGWVAGLVGKLLSFLVEVGLGIIVGIFEGITRSLAPIFEVFVEIRKELSELFTELGKAFQPLIDVFSEIMGKSGEASEGFDTLGVTVQAVAMLVRIVLSPIVFILKAIAIIIKGLTFLVSGFVRALIPIISYLVKPVVIAIRWWRRLFNTFTGGRGLMASLSDSLKKFFEDIGEIPQAIIEAILGIPDAMIEAMKGAFLEFKKWMRDVVKEAEDFFGITALMEKIGPKGGRASVSIKAGKAPGKAQFGGITTQPGILEVHPEEAIIPLRRLPEVVTRFAPALPGGFPGPTPAAPLAVPAAPAADVRLEIVVPVEVTLDDMRLGSTMVRIGEEEIRRQLGTRGVRLAGVG